MTTLSILISMPKSKTKEGKEFEVDFSNSIPLSTWCYRIPDNASSFGGGTMSRFANDSRYDYLLWNGFSDKNLYSLELKSCQGTSIAFCDYRSALQYELCKRDKEEFKLSIRGTRTIEQKERMEVLKQEEKRLSKECKSKSIKYHQICNLYVDSLLGSKSYFIFNFRKIDKTYAVPIGQFIEFWSTTDKKSINSSDIESLKHILIPQEKIGRSKKWKFDVGVLGFKNIDLGETIKNIVLSKTPFLNSEKKDK